MADHSLFPVISHLPHTVVYNRIMPLIGEMYAHVVCRMHTAERRACRTGLQLKERLLVFQTFV